MGSDRAKAAGAGAITPARPPSRVRRPLRRGGLPALAAASVALALVPLVYLAVRIAEADPGDVLTALLRGRNLQLAANTLGLVMAVSLAALVVGVASAWLIARTDLRARGLWLVVLALPLAIPSYVAAFGWVASTPLRGFWGSFVVLTLCNTPLVMLPTIAALRLANPVDEDVARTLGRDPWRAFFSATWPQVRPAALAGTLLVALYVLSDFGAVAIMRYQAFTWAIANAYGGLFDRTLAAVMALVLAAMGIAVVAAERRARGRAAVQGSAVRSRRAPTPIALGRWAVAVYAGMAGIAVASLGVPLATLVRYLASRVSTSTRVSMADVAGDFMSTLSLAVAGALVALLLALPVGVLAARRPSRLATTLESASYVGLALPGIVVGLSLVFFSLAVAPALYQSIWLLTFAYGVLFLSKAVGAVRTSVAQVEPGLEDVARTLGHRPIRVWTRVTARIAWPGIGAGMLLVALTAMKELPATLLLRPTGTDTLATSLWRYTESGAYAAAAPYALALVLVAVVPALLLTREAVFARPFRGEAA